MRKPTTPAKSAVAQTSHVVIPVAVRTRARAHALLDSRAISLRTSVRDAAARTSHAAQTTSVRRLDSLVTPSLEIARSVGGKMRSVAPVTSVAAPPLRS